MKKILFLTFLMLAASCLASRADVAAGVSVNNAGTSFFISIGDYFSATQNDVSAVRERGIPDEEIPVVFFLARKAEVAPATIMELRLRGESWQLITASYGYGAEIFYVPVEPNAEVAPPYGHAYGYYRDKPRKEWNRMSLQDSEIINLVNLKFLSEHFSYPADSIMQKRHADERFYTINDDIEKQRMAEKNPDHATGTKKQAGKFKKFIKKI